LLEYWEDVNPFTHLPLWKAKRRQDVQIGLLSAGLSDDYVMRHARQCVKG